jgi:lambda family phage portal protein
MNTLPDKRRLPSVQFNVLDRVVSWFSPKTALSRLRQRAQIDYLETSGFIVPGSSRRAMRGWNVSTNSADGDTIPKLNQARAGSRDLYMNSPMARAALMRPLINVVGSGLKFQARIDYDFLSMSKEEAEEWERHTEREFRLWSMSKDCDATRRLNFYEMQQLSFLSTMMNGDCFALLPMLPRKRHPIDLRIHLIEADYCCNPLYSYDTERMAGGIEIDRNGAPLNYYFKKRGSSQYTIHDLNALLASTDWVKVPAFGSNTDRRNVLHLYNPERISQRRGMPMLAPVFELVKQMSRLTEAELMASVINSFFTVIIKSSTNNLGLADGYIPEEQVTDESENAGDTNLYEMGHGNFLELNDDEEAQFADPKRPNMSFEPFFNAMCKQLGAAIGVPSEQLILQFETSYSAARAALQEAWKFYYQRRTWLVDNFCQPVYDEWLMEAIVKGRIDAPGFFDDPLIAQAWCGSAWDGIKPSELDPLKETKAKVLKIQNHLSTHEQEFESHDRGTWEQSMDGLAREQEHLRNLELTDTTVATKPKVLDPVVEDQEADKIEEVVEEMEV